jgi:hypothetical protein
MKIFNPHWQPTIHVSIGLTSAHVAPNEGTNDLYNAFLHRKDSNNNYYKTKSLENIAVAAAGPITGLLFSLGTCYGAYRYGNPSTVLTKGIIAGSLYAAFGNAVQFTPMRTTMQIFPPLRNNDKNAQKSDGDIILENAKYYISCLKKEDEEALPQEQKKAIENVLHANLVLCNMFYDSIRNGDLTLRQDVNKNLIRLRETIQHTLKELESDENISQ